MTSNLKEKYYTGKEVQKILGITEPSLRNLVNQKKLRKVIPPGRQNGLYLKTEVDRYAEKWYAFLAAEELPQTIFTTGKPEDMDAVYELSKKGINPITMNGATRRSWLAINSQSCYVVKYKDEVVAFFHLLPLKHERLIAFLDGKIRGWDLTGEDVEKFSPNKAVECLAIVASDPDAGETTRMHYMLVLLRGLASALEEMGQKGIIITAIYATSETPTGIAMAMHLGMEDYPPRLGKRVRFKLDIKEENSSFLIKKYKEGLERWKRTQHKTDSKIDSKDNKQQTTNLDKLRQKSRHKALAKPAE